MGLFREGRLDLVREEQFGSQIGLVLLDQHGNGPEGVRAGHVAPQGVMMPSAPSRATRTLACQASGTVRRWTMRSREAMCQPYSDVAAVGSRGR